MKRSRLSVGIVGGSLVGPFADLLMRWADVSDVTVYEAMTNAWPQAGGIIGLDSTGFDAIDATSIPLSELSAYPSHDVVTYDVANRHTGSPIVDQFEGETTAWDVFHGAVASRVCIKFGHRVVDMNDDGVLQFAHGDGAHHDLVLFADGRRSVGRRIFDAVRRPTYQGYTVWRGITTPMTDVRGFTRYRAPGYLFSITEKIVRGAHAGMSDWVWYENVPERQYTQLVGKSPTRKGFLLPHDFNDSMRQHVIDSVAQVLPDDVVDAVHHTEQFMGVPINDIPLPSRAVYRRGKTRVALLGDALMVVRPHSGRGLNNGIEQAWSLARHLTRGGDLDDVLLDWQAEIIPPIIEYVELGVTRARGYGLGTQL